MFFRAAKTPPAKIRAIACALACAAALVFAGGCSDIPYLSRIIKRESRPGQTVFKNGASSLPAQITAGYFIVEVKWDKHGPWRFIVDTGSSVTLLSPEYVARYRALAPGDAGARPISVRSASGGVDTLTPAHVRVIQLGGVQFRNVPVLVYDCAGLSAHFGVKIDGILGFPLFRDTVFTLDYPRARLDINRPGAIPPASGSAIAFNNEKHAPIISVQLGDENFSALIDTGNDGALALNPVGLNPVFLEKPRPGTSVGTFSGDRVQEIGRLAPSLRIGAYTVDSPVADITDQLSSIGGALLKNYRLTFDQKDGSVTFFRDSGAPLVLGPQRSAGLGFTKTPAYWRVAAVIPGSPAASAGVQAGDIVSRINGEPVSAWPLQRYDALVRRAGEITFTFVVGNRENSTAISTFDLVR